jgi:hypothetical protein
VTLGDVPSADSSAHAKRERKERTIWDHTQSTLEAHPLMLERIEISDPKTHTWHGCGYGDETVETHVSRAVPAT